MSMIDIGDFVLEYLIKNGINLPKHVTTTLCTLICRITSLSWMVDTRQRGILDKMQKFTESPENCVLALKILDELVNEISPQSTSVSPFPRRKKHRAAEQNGPQLPRHEPLQHPQAGGRHALQIAHYRRRDDGIPRSSLPALRRVLTALLAVLRVRQQGERGRRALGDPSDAESPGEMDARRAAEQNVRAAVQRVQSMRGSAHDDRAGRAAVAAVRASLGSVRGGDEREHFRDDHEGLDGDSEQQTRTGQPGHDPQLRSDRGSLQSGDWAMEETRRW